ncbi:hypothetical protein L249_5145 [Ophiocordyceps polyrhachis-furcata BCC 54312]|uniref:Uncharacterized protein n=1 Tax=Ophiocordyceps polyrhachis-furcata BCC 54312 TaxID=1330021 RepID=A0A367L3N7_9HYPO|nr:hypothetical protein L249_5145 [Ophiocordyceps polyrhachis-furcata BCC 54312]
MRYDDWDILLFPRDSKAPFKEFKVACHVVHDPEFSHTHGSGLPTVCCFVPSLEAGSPFRVSIHSWINPTTSQYTKPYTKFSDKVKFEARLFIDGRLIASTVLERSTESPDIISFGYHKNSELEWLKFPPFRRELLQQSFWNPADDLGRIKIVISEGFQRDPLSTPVERVKNIVVFSFQHAPIGGCRFFGSPGLSWLTRRADILESSCIAWPNPSMWRQALFAPSMHAPSYPSQDAFSPRHRMDLNQDGRSRYPIPVIPKPFDGLGSRRATLPVCSSLPHGKATADGLGDTNAYIEWLTGMGTGVVDAQRTGGQGFSQHRNPRRSSTDISMPDYTSMEFSEGIPAPLEQPHLPSGLRQEEEESSGHLRVPTNTPTASGQVGNQEQDGVPFPILSFSSSMQTDLANSLTNSLLNQPMPVHFQQQQQQHEQKSGFSVPAIEVKSRKENRVQQATAPSPSLLPTASGSTQEHQEMRRVSQQMYLPSGASLPVCMVPPSAETVPAQDCVDSSQGASLTGGEQTNTPANEGLLANETDNITEKGLNRLRNFTPLTARGVDEDKSELRRGSPATSRTPITHDLTGDDDDD